MMHISTIGEVGLLKETYEIECKLAVGSDGQGRLPKDIWPTYSAFANSYGGIILLGIKERAGSFEVNGISSPDKVRTDLFNQLNNPQKVSVNLLSDRNVYVENLEGKSIVVIDVPRANRKQRPVYINGNPMIGTYRRLNDGDRLCNSDEVRRLLAEQIDDTRDIRILKGYTLADLNTSSLQAYRRMLRDKTPEHPYLDSNDKEFLRRIGGWCVERETGETGLTVAGLLMFGRFETIREEFPDYFLDYQERPEPRKEQRWID